MAHITALVSRVHSAKVTPSFDHVDNHDGTQILPETKRYKRYVPPKDMVILNIGGTRFETSVKTLKAVPNTRLSALADDYEWFKKGDGLGKHPEFVFDHSPFMFQFILDYYRTGEMHLPAKSCSMAISEELNYWGLKESCIAVCCWQQYMCSKDRIRMYKRLHREFEEQRGEVSKQRADKAQTCRQRLWTFLANSNSSKGAKAYSILTSFLILLNISTYMLGTLSALREQAPYYGSLDKVINASSNSSADDTNDAVYYLSQESRRNSKLHLLLTTQPHFVLFYFDIVCFVYFTVEYSVMLAVSPNRLKFARSFLAVCDILYLIPLGLMLIIYYIDKNFDDNPDTVIGIIILQGLMAFRVLRIIRVVRHYRGFVVLALALRASARELLLLGLLMVVALLFFANAIFFAELLQHDTFDTVFQGFWWSLITITTIGYGDMYPKSISGYLIGGACAMAGLILVSIPIPIIANNFNTYYGFKNKRPQDKAHWHGTRGSEDDDDKSRRMTAYMPVTVI